MRSAILVAIMAWMGTVISAVPIEEPIHALPMRRLPLVRDLEHPVMAFQRHQNAAVRRLHAMTGTDGPSDAELLARTIARRDEILSGDMGKRMWFPPDAAKTAATPAVKRTWFLPEGVPDVREGDGASASPVSEVKRMWIPEGGVPAVEVTKTKRQAAPAAATTTITASGSNAAGFSRAGFQALMGQALLNSTAELVQGGLPYIIEFNDIGYLIEVPMGTPSQTFLILADTGSGDTWVHSTDCRACGDHLALGAETSSTFRLSQTQWSITYGSGAAAGLICADTMTIAGMTLKDHIFGVSTQLSVQFTADTVPFDGLMGLSFNALSNQRALTPIDALKEQGEIQQTVLGIALGRVADGQNDGELVFGNVNAAKLDAATTQTIPVSSANGHWQVDLGAVTVDGNEVATARQAILDTGTSLMVAPEADAQAFHAQIPGARALQGGMFSIPCTTDTVVTMTFGQAAFQIDLRDMLFQPLTNDLAGQCISSLSAGTIIDDQTWLLGDSFLKNVYMATNVEDKTVSLSGRADVQTSSSSGQGGGADPASGPATAGSRGGTAGQGNATQVSVGSNAAVNPSDAKARSASTGYKARGNVDFWWAVLSATTVAAFASVA